MAVPIDDKPMEKGGAEDCSKGPVKNRHCTDILCCMGFITHWIVFVILFSIALSEGEPARLTSHRDFKGAYCGQKDNWNPWNNEKNGQRWDMTNYPKMAYTMNLDGFFDMINIQSMICPVASPSSVGGLLIGQALSQLSTPVTAAEYNTAYTKGCMNLPLGDGSDPTAVIAQFTDPAKLQEKAVEMFAGKGIADKIKTYFYSTCVRDCTDLHNFAQTRNTPDLAGVAGGNWNPQNSAFRHFFYSPTPDKPHYEFFRLIGQAIKQNPGIIATAPTLGALFAVAMPKSLCPEDPQYCVSFPGLEYNDIAGLCMFSMGANVGGAAADAISGAMETGAAGEVGASFGSMIGDITTTYPAIIIMAFLSLVIGMLFMVFLRFAVGFMVWGSVFLMFAMLGAAAGYFYLMTTCEEKEVDFQSTSVAQVVVPPVSSSNNNTNTNSTSITTTTTATSTASSGSSGRVLQTVRNEKNRVEECKEPDIGMRDMYTYLFYFFISLASLYILFVFCMCTRIKLGVAINKVAAKFVYQTKPVIFVPVFQIGIAMIWWVVWSVAALHLVSQVSDDALPQGPFTRDKALGTPTEPGECNGSWPAGGAFVDNELVGMLGTDGITRTKIATTPCDVPNDKNACYRCTLPSYAITPQFAYAFFSLLWNNAFIVAIGQCTVAGAVAFWYFTPNEEKGSRAAVRPAFINCFRYHLGSLAFGACILAVVQFIKWTLYYIQKNAEQQKNVILVKVAKAMQCLIQCFERFIKFLNKNAYIQIAILGQNFCKSAWNAFCLVMRNSARIGILGMIGGMVKYIGLIFITGGTTVLGYFILMSMYEEEISSPAIPMLIFFMIGYMVGQLFMNVFALGVDATLQCFVADEELNSGSGGAAHTPEELKAFIKDSKGGCC